MAALSEVITCEGDEVILHSKDKSKVLGRFPFGKGKKYASKESATTAAKAREGQVQFFKHQESYAEIDKSFMDLESDISRAFRQQFVKPTGQSQPIEGDDRPYVFGIYPEGYLICQWQSKYYRVDYTPQNNTYVFPSQSGWIEVEKEWTPVNSAEQTGEAYREILGEHDTLRIYTNLAEAMTADIAVLKPGFGNPADNHYYPPDVVKRDVGVFQGAKMYATNHDEKEHNVRNWVATVTECGARFTQDGTPIARIAVHDNNFWGFLKNLDEQGLLHTMHTSILGAGETKKGKVGGKDANIVERIVNAKSIDFVNRAGAGGHVMQLVEQLRQEGDLDAATVDILKERRPDLVEAVCQAYIKEHQIKQEVTTMPDETKVLSEADRDALKRLAEMEEANAELEEQLAEAMQVNLKNLAVQKLYETQTGKLPAAALKRISSVIQEGVFEEDADVEKIVEALVKEEAEYVKELLAESAKPAPEKPKSNVAGLSESYTESPKTEEKPQKTLAECSKSIDEIVAAYTGQPIMEVKK